MKYCENYKNTTQRHKRANDFGKTTPTELVQLRVATNLQFVKNEKSVIEIKCMDTKEGREVWDELGDWD